MVIQMKIIGIIAEYNPLHNGHVYHFNSIKKDDDDILIAVISGSVVNRGEVSVFNKFDKTSLALQMGVDIVLEIPSVYVLQSSNTFARRAIELLHLCNVTDIYFGSEENNLELIKIYYDASKGLDYNDILKEYLSLGYSYKSSSIEAFNKLGLKPLNSNDMLALSYYCANVDYNYNINLHTIKRENNYSSTSLCDTITSATSLRLNSDKLLGRVPNYSYDLFLKKGFYDNNKIFDFLKVIILSSNLRDIFLIEEGFENSLKQIYKYSDYKSFLKSLNTKRYSIAKIERIMLNILFNIKKDDMLNINKQNLDFIRVLGFNSVGQKYLNSIKSMVKVYTNIKNGINDILDIEIKISKILDTIYKDNLLSLEQKSPIIIKNTSR